MTTATITLTDFLLARIAEDKAVAQEAIDPDRPGTHWCWINNADDTATVPSDEYVGHEYMTGPADLRTVEEFSTPSGGSLPSFALSYVEELRSGPALHIARHDPARVLAECAAKRAIVALHRDGGESQGYTDAREYDYGVHENACTSCGYLGEFGVAWPCPTLRAIAAVYADHPDYREEWRP